MLSWPFLVQMLNEIKVLEHYEVEEKPYCDNCNRGLWCEQFNIG